MLSGVLPAAAEPQLPPQSAQPVGKADLHSRTVIFGAILPLTGNAADQGQWAKNGLELAASELNAAGDSGRPTIRLVFEDSKGDPKTAISAYTTLRTRYSVPVIFTWGSGVGIALTPLVNRDRVVQIGIATGSPDYRTVGDYTFRTFHSNLDEAAYADSVIDKFSGGGKGRVGIVKIQNDYGIGYGDRLSELLKKRGKKVAFDDTFAPNETDFKSLLLKLKATRPTVMMLITYPTEGAAILSQMRQLGITTPVLASVAILSSRSFFDLAKGAAEGLRIIVPSNQATNESEAMKRFMAGYLKKYNEDIGIYNWYAARAFDAVEVVASVLGDCPGSEAQCIRDHLFTIKDYQGAAGSITFDPAGDITTDFSLVVIRGRKFFPDQAATGETQAGDIH